MTNLSGKCVRRAGKCQFCNLEDRLRLRLTPRGASRIGAISLTALRRKTRALRVQSPARSQRRWMALAATTPSAIDVTTQGCMRWATSPMA